MSQLVIEIDNPEDEALLIRLLPKLNGRIVSKEASTAINDRKEKLSAIFDRLRDSGVAEKYGDPSEWQREVRQDRPLAGREDDY
ncbi:hypothetical protein [Spirosoma panaciterrae]|uniref:hypothetical protein n=1 Tax=Spirosoma panaciterrae TaxID=496058 RepID=UPI0003631540|nr:hypothetical protein [Spirosoma panaciterrae]